jgi:hypothetical protein
MEQLAVGIFLASANFALVNYLADPVRQKWPELDLWWLVYVSLATGIALSWVSGANLYTDFIADTLASRIVTALTIGGGSNLVYAVFGNRQEER